MTRVRKKRMKDALQGLILQVQDTEIALQDSMTKFKGSIVSQSMVTYLIVKGMDSEDPNEDVG